jgi:hypothetical protein
MVFTSGEEYRLGAFGNRVKRKTFGCKREEVTWDWRKLHNEELQDLYTRPCVY